MRKVEKVRVEDRLTKVKLMRASLVSSLLRLGSEPAVFPMVLSKYKRELASPEISTIQKDMSVDQARQFVDGVSDVQILPFCDLFNEKQRQQLCSSDRKYEISTHNPALISFHKVITQLRILLGTLPKKSVFEQLKKAIEQLLSYYQEHFERLCAAQNQGEIRALLEPKAWAVGAGLAYFYIAPTQTLSSSEVALSNLLLRTLQGDRIEKAAGSFGNSTCGRIYDLHVKPAQVGWYIDGIKRHNSAGSWLQYWNTRHPVYVPAVSIKVSHIETQLGVMSEHEFEKIKPILTEVPLSGRSYLRNHIKLSPLVEDGVDLAIVFETMSAIYNWRQQFSIEECAKKLKLIELDNVVDDVNQWPEELVEHSGCKEHERLKLRLPAYIKAMQKLIPDYSHEKALREFPQILSKVCDYSYTSLIFAALGAGMEDLTGANIMLCPTDERKEQYYFRVIDAKRAYFHTIFQKGNIHYPYIAFILLTMPNIFDEVSAEFFEELTSDDPQEQMFGYCSLQYEDDEKDQKDMECGEFTQRDIKSGIAEGVQLWHADTLPEKARVIKKAHAMWDDNTNMTNLQFASGLQPALMLYLRTVAYPILNSSDNVGWSINKAFTAATYRSAPFEKVFLGKQFETLQFKFDPESRQRITELAKRYMIDESFIERTSLFDLLKSYYHGNLDYQNDATLTIQEAIVKWVRTINPKNYLEPEQWQKMYCRWKQKLPFLEGLDDLAVESKIRGAALIVLSGNATPLHPDNIEPSPARVFNCIRWSEIYNRVDRRFGGITKESVSPRDASPRSEDTSPTQEGKSRSNSLRTLSQIISPRKREGSVSSRSPRKGASFISSSPRKRASGGATPRSASFSKRNSSPRSQIDTVREILVKVAEAKIIFTDKFRLIDCVVPEDTHLRALLDRGRCESLTSVDVRNSLCASDDVFYTLSQLEKLQTVVMSNTAICDLTRNIAFPDSVTKLVARNCNSLTSAILQLPGLTHLDFSGCANLRVLDVGKGSALRYLNLAGCYSLEEGYVTRVLLESPHLTVVVLPSNRLKYNLRTFVEFSFRQNRLQEKRIQTQFLDCINQGGEVNFYGVDFPELLLRDLVATLASSTQRSLVSRLDFTGCKILKKSILSYVGSLATVETFTCNKLYMPSDLQKNSATTSYDNKAKLQVLRPLLNGQVLTVAENGVAQIWNSQQLNSEYDFFIGVKPIIDVTVTPEGGFFVLTPYALYIKRYFNSELQKISDAAGYKKIITINNQRLAIFGAELKVFKKSGDQFEHEVTFSTPGLYDVVAGYGERLVCVSHHKNQRVEEARGNNASFTSEIAIYETNAHKLQQLKTKSVKGDVVAPLLVGENEVVFARGKNVWCWSINKTYDARLIFTAEKNVRKIVLLPLGQLALLTSDNGLHLCRWDLSQKEQQHPELVIVPPMKHIYCSHDGSLVYTDNKHLCRFSAVKYIHQLSFRNEHSDLFKIDHADKLRLVIQFSGKPSEQTWQNFVRFAMVFLTDYQPSQQSEACLELQFHTTAQREMLQQHLKSLIEPASRAVPPRILKSDSDLVLAPPIN